MYNKILVALDGSQFSECSLDHLKNVVSGNKAAEVVLLRVADSISNDERERVVEERGGDTLILTQTTLVESENTTAATNYINSIAERLKGEGLNVQGEVTHGRPADNILDYAINNQIDLIVMTTHGRSGISRWTMGSVAERIVRHSPVPVLLVSPSGCRGKLSK